MSVATGRLQARRAYDGLVVVVVVGALVYGAAGALLAPLTATAAAALGAPRVGVLAALGLAAAALVGLAQLGPVWATRTELQWHAGAPLVGRRSRWVVAALATAAALTAGLLGVVAVGAGLGATSGAVLGGGVVVAAGAAAYVGQRLDRASWVRSAGVACAALAVGLVCVDAGTWPVAVLLVGGLYAVVLGAVRPARGSSSPRWYAAPPRWELVRAGESVDALRTSTIMLDGAARELLRDTRLPPGRRRLRASGALLLTVRTVTSSRVAALLPVLALPAGVGVVWGAGVSAAALQVVTMVFAIRCARPVETWLDSAALRRTFALPGRSVPTMLVGSAAALVVAYAACGALIAGVPLLWVPVAVGLSVLVVLRRLSGRRLGGRVGALVSTAMGGVPIDLTARVTAGSDVLVLGPLLVYALGAPAAALVVTGGVMAYFLLLTRRGR